MSSLRSSSALAYNFFGPWIGHDLSPLAGALGQSVADGTVRFERQFRHGLSSMPPNIDVTLDNDQERPLAIECKFTEPYGNKKPHSPLDKKYFAGGRKRWAELKLPRCQELAEAIGDGLTFRRLGAGQLVKHLLGLAWTTKLPPRLVCLWFDTGCPEANEHRAEIERFRAHLDGAVEFAALTYQSTFARLRGTREPVPKYFNYLRTRYFAV
jgi:hypothetical protein